MRLHQKAAVDFCRLVGYYGFMDIEEILEVVRALPDPAVGDIGRLLFVQGALMQHVGLAALDEAVKAGGTRRILTATTLLNGAENALSKSAALLGKKPSPELFEERKRLLEMAYERGYEIAFEADGRLTLECQTRLGSRLEIESV